MVHDPQKGDKQTDRAGSLLFFVVAILVMVVGASLELLQHIPPLQVRSHVLLILVLAAVFLLLYRLRSLLH